MHAPRRHLGIVALVVSVLPALLGSLSACGGAALPEETSQAGASGDDTGLILFARPRLTAAAGLDEPGRLAVALEVEPYVSGEDILVDLSEGRAADVVEVCSDETAERLARQGLLQPLDTGRIAEWDRVHPALRDLPGVMVDGEVYMVPLTAAVTGLLYDPVETTRPPRSFADLFAPRFEGRLGFADDAALAFQIAALDLGLPDPTALTDEQTLAVRSYLRGHDEQFGSFWRDLDNLASAFRSGRVTVAVGDRRAASELEGRGVPVAFALAEEGQPLTTCGLAITAGARDVEAAYALIDYILQPSVQARLATATGEMPANRDASALLDAADRTRLGVADLDRLSRPVALLPELEHIDWIEGWYAVKKGRG